MARDNNLNNNLNTNLNNNKQIQFEKIDKCNLKSGSNTISEKEKLEQLHAMVVNSSWLDDDKPCEEFKELLSSLPIETVIVFLELHI